MALTYDRKLLAAWRRVLKRDTSTVPFALTTEPGTWDALRDVLGDGTVPPGKLWKFSAQVLAHAPARVLPALFEAPDPGRTDLTVVYGQLAASLPRALLENPSLFEGKTHEDDILTVALEVARLQVGQLPAGSGSAAVRAWVETWAAQVPRLFPVRDGAVQVSKGSKNTPEELREVGERLVGPQLGPLLAAGVRKVMGKLSFEWPVLLAAEGLTPEELVSFTVHPEVQQALFERWSPEERVRAVKGAAARGGYGLTMAHNLALLTIARDPGLAPEVESGLLMKDFQSTITLPAVYTYWALRLTAPAWLKRVLKPYVELDEGDQRHRYASLYGTPLALLLLGRTHPTFADKAHKRLVAEGNQPDFHRPLDHTWSVEMLAEVHASLPGMGAALREAIRPALSHAYGRREKPAGLG